MHNRPNMQLFKAFNFDAAHKLDFLPEGHPCTRLHGHSFQVEVVLNGQPDENGMILDLGTVEEKLNHVRSELDHTYLNDIEGLENPTLERLTEWIWQRLDGQLSGLSEITIRRATSREGCTYFGPNGKARPRGAS